MTEYTVRADAAQIEPDEALAAAARASVHDSGAVAPVGREAAPSETLDGSTSPAGEPRQAFALSLEAQTAELRDLRLQVQRFHDRSRAQEDVIERMQTRIENLQADQVRALLGPVATELATLHGELSEIASRDPDTLTVERVTKEIALLVQRVESGLELLGMEPVGAAPGVTFDRRWHSATGRVPTDDPDRDQTIASVVRQGFGAEGAARATVMARVAVYQYDPQLAAPQDSRPDPAADGPAPPVESPFAESLPVEQAAVVAPPETVDVAAPSRPAPSPPDVPRPPTPPGYDES
ncbi:MULTISPECIES: nucleotide exchange factor GrpE [unclassified Modestobacter]|uniref:nucleotide exchange factor GrpE n=1 Tax=unclassified Modestobacter TaxID=2643866 RepID=UPI0022AB202F|nr:MULTISPECIES: nucleotide exchange factor GrpE [unclassified Modestobacter]MCZ2826074.1 nucleotide exchange factor GrpE [Modestobacter sp. VKM Ac-2981]MCZ2852861.1 nucleotide exchange factor GrpE [Modestobacter sp. VKM Ac-2982]